MFSYNLPNDNIETYITACGERTANLAEAIATRTSTKAQRGMPAQGWWPDPWKAKSSNREDPA
jgi:hypothetical protein